MQFTEVVEQPAEGEQPQDEAAAAKAEVATLKPADAKSETAEKAAEAPRQSAEVVHFDRFRKK